MKHRDCDVLVVGSGVAGFTAALKLKSLGLEVLIVEKEPQFGGTTAYSAGMAWIPANPAARKKGDSADKAMTYLRSEAGNGLDLDRAKAFIDNCYAAIAFLEAVSDIRFTAAPSWPDYHPDAPGAAAELRAMAPSVFDGRKLGSRFHDLRPPLPTMMLFGAMMVGRADLPHLLNARRSPSSALYCARILVRYLVDRTHFSRGTRLTGGNGLIAALAVAAFRNGIPLWLSSPLTKLVTEHGTVVGAIVRRSGEDIELSARKGVVLACGGFSWDEQLKSSHFAHVKAAKNHASAVPPGNTGTGIHLALEIGARFDDAASNAAAWAPVSLVPQASGPPIPYPHFLDRAKPGVIIVNRHGMRFANEAVSYHDFVPRMIEACRSDHEIEAFVIADHSTFRKYGLGAAPPAPAPYGGFIRSGYLLRGETISDLALKAGINAAGLRSTIAEFNRYAENGMDLRFGKGSNAYQRFQGDHRHTPNPCLGPIRKSPFFAVRVVPGDLGTFMGLRTDHFGRVLGEAQPIAGLYAVGNDAASVFAGSYPGAGGTIGPAITFAYLAATHIAGDSGSPTDDDRRGHAIGEMHSGR